MSTVPLTSSTEAFTPACLQDIEGAPTLTFRDATVLDKYQFQELSALAKLRRHDTKDLREVIIHELKKLFESDGMAHNITRLEAYWNAIDERESAFGEWRQQVVDLLDQHEGDGKPDLPEEPELDFPDNERVELDALINQVERSSDTYAGMLADNIRHETRYPLLMLRMYLTETSLDVDLERDEDGALTPSAANAVIKALSIKAIELGASPDKAVSQLLLKAVMRFSLTAEEAKNSSSPRSGHTSPKLSAKQSRSKASKSPTPTDTEAADGPSSSE